MITEKEVASRLLYHLYASMVVQMKLKKSLHQMKVCFDQSICGSAIEECDEKYLEEARKIIEEKFKEKK